MEELISEELNKVARGIEEEVKKDLAQKLEEVYKEQIQLSYTPRSSGEYEHTGLFVDSVYTKIDDNEVKGMLQDNTYPNGRSTIDVYTFLTEGTNGGGSYPYEKDGETSWAHNYPTPPHLFEEATATIMRGYLDTLANELKKKGR